VSLTAPSIPTHSDAYVVAPDAHVTVGTVQLPATAENVAPVTSYPDQFVDSPSADVTESNAGIVVALPAEFVNVASYSHPFSAEVAVKVYVADVAPEIALQLAPEFVETDHATLGVGVPEAAAEKEAVVFAGAETFSGSVVTTGATVVAVVTVNVAGAVVALPPALVNVAWNSQPLSEDVAVNAYVVDVAPEIVLQLAPEFVETDHATLGVGVPVAPALNAAVDPPVTVRLDGERITLGATAWGVVTPSVAGEVVTLPKRFVNVASYSHPFSVEVAVKVYVADVAPEIALQLAPEFVETDHATVGVGVPEAAAEKEAVAPEATVIELGSDVTCGALPPGGVVVVVTGAVTVSVASADVTLPALLENVAWNSSPFSAVDATRKYEDPDPPGSGTHVVPPSLETSHVSLGVGTPVAVEVKVTGVPAVTVTLAGSVVTTGATADAPTVSVAAVETAAPRRFVNTARTRRPESVVSATIE
jgi:hypothetical protein